MGLVAASGQIGLDLNTIASIASFILAAAAGIITVTWQISRIQISLKDELAQQSKERVAMINSLRDELEQRQDSLMRDIGETIAALRQKLHQTEIWSRDTFVRRETFISVLGENKTSLVELGERLEKRLDRLEEKLDEVTNRHG